MNDTKQLRGAWSDVFGEYDPFIDLIKSLKEYMIKQETKEFLEDMLDE